MFNSDSDSKSLTGSEYFHCVLFYHVYFGDGWGSNFKGGISANERI